MNPSFYDLSSSDFAIRYSPKYFNGSSGLTWANSFNPSNNAKVTCSLRYRLTEDPPTISCIGGLFVDVVDSSFDFFAGVDTGVAELEATIGCGCGCGCAGGGVIDDLLLSSSMVTPLLVVFSISVFVEGDSILFDTGCSSMSIV